VVPGWYGVASVKWLTAIELVDHSFDGPFQATKYWYETAEGDREPVTLQRVRALITEPADGEILPAGETTVRGVAWSGAAPIVGSKSASTTDPGQTPVSTTATPVAMVGAAHSPRTARAAQLQGTGDRPCQPNPARDPRVEPPRLRQQRHSKGCRQRQPMSSRVAPRMTHPITHPIAEIGDPRKGRSFPSSS
jgi:hypothetical protein